MVSAGMILRFVIFVAFWAGLNALLTWRFLSGWAVAKPVKYAFCALVLSSFVITPFAFALRGAAPVWLRQVAFLLMGLLFLVYTLIVLRDLALGMLWLASKLGLGDPLPNPERRAVFKDAANWAILAGASSVGVAATANARRMPKVFEIDVPIKDLPNGLDGFSIAQISDIHVGSTVDADKLQYIANQVEALKPDLFAVTGDLVDGSVADLGEQVQIFNGVNAKYGTYFCTGNHEYYSGALSWCDFLTEQGWTVLNNEHRVIETENGRLLLAGVTDLHGSRFIESHQCRPGEACRAAPEDVDVRVLLAHQPKVAFLTERGQYDLQLSGHTHGGQYFPFNFLIHLVQRYVAGLYRHQDMWVYVNRGPHFGDRPCVWGPSKKSRS